MIVANLLLHITGGDNGSGPFYLELSGFIAILGYLSFATAWYRKHNCHVKGCPRFGHHPFKHYMLCRKHHPETPQVVSHLYIKKLHKEDQ